MLINPVALQRQIPFLKENLIKLVIVFCIGFLSFLHVSCVYGDYAIGDLNPYTCGLTVENRDISLKSCKKYTTTYYLYISDFADSFIEIPTSNVSMDSTTISSKYLAGRASIYNQEDRKYGTCSASFLCMQNADGIYTDISNYLSADNGLIVSWFTPTTLINLELDSIIHSMVTKCLVEASTKIGFNPFYGDSFELIVSSDDEKIYFQFTER